MRNSTKIAISAFFLALVVSEIAFLSTSVSAAEYKVGAIRRGNWATYGYYYELIIRNYTNPEQPEDFSVIGNETGHGYTEVKVEKILGTFVELSVTMSSEDGTRQEERKSGDVKTGEGLEFYLIAGDLRSGDRIRDKEDEPEIRKTISQVYANASREINQAEFEREGIDEEGAFQIRWDRKTGFLCEMMAWHNYYSEEENYVIVNMMFMKLLMLETDLWRPEELNGTDSSEAAFGVAMVLVVIGTFAGALLLIKKRR